MFEQSLYEQEPVVQPLEEGDLFGTYEIKSWGLSPRIYKILGASAMVNVLALLVFAQTSLLTMKGCDSPLVGSVCKVLDTVYIGTMLFGTEREYVDADYEKTELTDPTIVFTELPAESEKLYYPADYFQIANPIQYQASVDAMNNPVAGTEPGFLAPGIPITRPYISGGSVLDTKPNPPKPSNDVYDDLPSINDSGTSNDTAVKRPIRPRPNNKIPKQPKGIPEDATPKVDPGTVTAENEEPDGAKPDKNGVYLNKRPLTDFAEDTKAKSAVITPDAIYKVVMTGELGFGKDKDGKDTKTIVLKNPQPIETIAGNSVSAEMAKLTQEGILRVGDSGWLGYLHTVGVKKVKITVIQDNNDFKFTLQADQKDENTAKTAASGLSGFISIGKLTSDGDEKRFLESAKTTFEGKTFLLNFAMPKVEVLEMIKRKLAEPKKADSNAAQIDRSKLTTGK